MPLFFVRFRFVVAGSLVGAALGVLAAVFPARAVDLPTMGLIEEVLLPDLKMRFLAKTDTGALTSVINSQNIEMYKFNGQDWVRFTIINKKGQRKDLSMPVFRIVDIQRAGTKDEYRPVVIMKMCLGGVLKDAQFALKDRKGMLYPMLIGRRIINGNFLVDPAKKKTDETELQIIKPTGVGL